MNPVGPKSADEQLREAIRRLPASDGPPAALDARIRERARAAVAPARRRRLPPLWLSAAASVFVAFFAINLLRQSGQAPSLEQQLAPAQRAPVAAPDAAVDGADAGVASDADISGEGTADNRSMAEPAGAPLPEQRAFQAAEPDGGESRKLRQLQPATEHETASTRKREGSQPQTAPARSRLAEEVQHADDAAIPAPAEPEPAPAVRPQAFPADNGAAPQARAATTVPAAAPPAPAPAPPAPAAPPPAPVVVAEPPPLPARDAAKPAEAGGPASLGTSAAKAEPGRSAGMTGALDEAGAAPVLANESKEDAEAGADRSRQRRDEAASDQPTLRRQQLDDSLSCLADQPEPCLAQVRRWLAEGRREEAVALLRDTVERFPQALPVDLQNLLH